MLPVPAVSCVTVTRTAFNTVIRATTWGRMTNCWSQWTPAGSSIPAQSGR